MKIVLLIQLFTTLFMVGLIWFVQIVHYPLFAQVGNQEFTNYERRHQRLTTWVVGPIMLLELTSALGLFLFIHEGVPLSYAWTGIVLLGLIWLSTLILQVPVHERMASGFSESDHAWLLNSNWLRTIAWTARAGLILSLTIQML